MKLKRNSVVLSLEEYDRLKNIESTYGQEHTVMIDHRQHLFCFNPTIYTSDKATLKLSEEYKKVVDENFKLQNELNTLKAENIISWQEGVLSSMEDGDIAVIKDIEYIKCGNEFKRK